jgi:hypothetical protein
MWAWLRRFIHTTDAVVAEADAPAVPVMTLPEPAPPPEPKPPEAPAELLETLDVVRKMARAQSKLALKLDEVDANAAKRLDELKAVIPAPPPALAWGDLLDAMDLLQHAIEAIDPAHDDVADGLARVLGRLDRFLAQGGFRRVGARGEPVDGKLFRVIGAESHPGLSPGTIARVVRAAAVRDGQVVREGEVLTVRNTQ